MGFGEADWATNEKVLPSIIYLKKEISPQNNNIIIIINSKNSEMAAEYICLL